jgi:hypothetical protein
MIFIGDSLMKDVPDSCKTMAGLVRKTPHSRRDCPEALQQEEQSLWQIADGVWNE